MHRRHFLGALASLACLGPTRLWAYRAPPPVHLLDARLLQGPQGPRLVLHLSGEARVDVFSLASPPRTVIDLAGVVAASPPRVSLPPDSPVADVRHAAHGDGLRIVLDLRQPLQSHASVHTQADGTQQWIVALTAADMPLAVRPEHTAHPKRRPAVIAIDAGHGGKDPGAVSSTDVYEKHVALAIADRLHALLAADDRFAPTMIRDDDHFVPLHERVVIAHRRRADMFISIHADAAPNTQARGASVYALSEHGASSTMARWLAQSENSADRYEDLRDSALYSKNKQLSEVLLDMSMDATIAASLQLGALMLNDLSQVTRIHQHQVDQAGFAVLKSPDIPSVLVETGFMSNGDDCRRLVQDSHQQSLAESLHSGIRNFFHDYPLESRPA